MTTTASVDWQNQTARRVDVKKKQARRLADAAETCNTVVIDRTSAGFIAVCEELKMIRISRTTRRPRLIIDRPAILTVRSPQPEDNLRRNHPRNVRYFTLPRGTIVTRMPDRQSRTYKVDTTDGKTVVLFRKEELTYELISSDGFNEPSGSHAVPGHGGMGYGPDHTRSAVDFAMT